MVQGHPTKATLKKNTSLAFARKMCLKNRKTLTPASTPTPTPDDDDGNNDSDGNEDAKNQDFKSERSEDLIECTRWSRGVVNYISSDEEPLFISEEEEEVEDLLESELEEVIQQNRERSQGTTMVEQPVVGVVEEQPEAEPGAFSTIMGQWTTQEWKRAESTRSLGYNGQSSRTKRCREKAARDEEREDEKLRKG